LAFSMENEQYFLGLIMKGLHGRCGIDFSLYRSSTVKRRLERRMAATDTENYRDYFYALEKGPGEYERLLRALTIKVSRFFRNRLVFEVLADELFPDMIKTKEDQNDDTLRIWCAGCAYGEEVYSVAIMLVEYFRSHAKKMDDFYISIFGTDVDEEALNRARFGVYDTGTLREVERGILDRYFSPVVVQRQGPLRKFTHSEHNYQVIESIRRLVHFSEHDLASQTKKSPPSGVVADYDLIFCRNLLIYFSQPLQEKAFLNIVNSLNPGGYLILGKSESIPKTFETFFVPQTLRKMIYKKM